MTNSSPNEPQENTQASVTTTSNSTGHSMSTGSSKTRQLALLAILGIGVLSVGQLWIHQQQNKIVDDWQNLLLQQQTHLLISKKYESQLPILTRAIKSLQNQNLNLRLQLAKLQSTGVNANQLLLQVASDYYHLAHLQASVLHDNPNATLTLKQLKTQVDRMESSTLQVQIQNMITEDLDKIVQDKSGVERGSAQNTINGLQMIQNQIANLSELDRVAMPKNSEFSAQAELVPIPEGHPNSKAQLKSKLSQSMRKLQQLVVIRHYDPDHQNFLTLPELELFKQNVLLELEQAKIAVLINDAAMFQQSIGQCSMRLGRYLADNDPIKAQILKQLQHYQMLFANNTEFTLQSSFNRLIQLQQNQRFQR